MKINQIQLDEKRKAKILKEINEDTCDCSSCDMNSIRRDEKLSGIISVCLYAVVIGLIFIGGCLICKPVHADEIPQDKAIRTLIGEASNQGEKGMICVAEVLRRQGSLKGFYGYKANHVDHEPAYVWAMARRAWLASANTNYTHGANHFENVSAFGCPSWVKNCIETFRYKDHIFYKEVRNV